MKEKITVLIADDNPDFAMTLVSYLEKEEDMEVIGIAKNGKEACDMINKKYGLKIKIELNKEVLKLISENKSDIINIEKIGDDNGSLYNNN